MKKVYRITYEKLSGESADILAKTWDEAATKASKWLTNLNKELKETKMTDLDEFIETAQRLASEAEQGRKIAEAAKGGVVESDQYQRKADANEDDRIREMAREVIFETWNKDKRATSLKEVYDGVLRKIAQDIEDGAWPRIWFAHPLKRTVDRRTGELHEMDSHFWGPYDCPPCILVRAGYNQPNPMLFDEEIRKQIGEVAKG